MSSRWPAKSRFTCPITPAVSSLRDGDDAIEKWREKKVAEHSTMTGDLQPVSPASLEIFHAVQKLVVLDFVILELFFYSFQVHDGVFGCQSGSICRLWRRPLRTPSIPDIRSNKTRENADNI